MKPKSIVTSLALQLIKEVGMVAKQEHVSIAHDIECTCMHVNTINFRLSNFHYSKC